MIRQTLIETQLFTVSPQSITEAVKTERGNLLVEGRLQSAETSKLPLSVLTASVIDWGETVKSWVSMRV
jgi:hypothetical protein